MRKEEDFSEWYSSVIEKAELRDKRYPVKGMDVWLPYGWSVMKRIDQAWREEFDATGHREVNFPLLIPETEFKKEADHVKGFESDVYWVTHGGLNPLDIRLVLRPTSETAMYPMFALWIRSHADLPLKVYQIVSTFRYETKMTRTFLRVREIHFFESHTAHATFEDAQQQIQEDVPILEKGRQEEISRAALEVYHSLLPHLRVHLDDRDVRPGEKFYHWEAKGVPLRVELGPKDLAKGEVVIVQRRSGEKKSLGVLGLHSRLKSILELIQVDLFARAEKVMKDNITVITRLEDARDGINAIPWCGRESCGLTVTERTGMSVLGTPYYKEAASGKCAVCGEPAIELLYAAKAY